jgi:hypothetical protein
MPGCPEGRAGGQWRRGVGASKSGGGYFADPEAADGGAAIGKLGVYAGRGCGRRVPGREPWGLGPSGGGPHDSGAYLTHTQCHRKG